MNNADKKILRLAQKLFKEVDKAGYKTECKGHDGCHHMDLWIFDTGNLVLASILNEWELRMEVKK